ncbi:TPA: hypothetical protein L3V69_003112 [Vibrio parahaemolyticus]|uniref:hypothetical protein n=1 Tax=Vibrio parahaemolyticus TaxID=670 RepID=UPI0022B544F1|nr:hypothetical protein [Vibrio parahaemolyticus]ELB1989227.1 hypothetical protein [Vibrio parahaemolyticus]MCZ6311102.1 hypothetical protein [Vibrio parahaemolyticus]HBN6178895.1 hypothetical protein [Vibrio parahaemolyticus]HBN6318072.1 hypothetical protein [Vibrio parahaemolyticus]HCD5130799.1 hypothetical protein [Vibrio parahaemolyticus]
MPKKRPDKSDHLIATDASTLDSRAKAGVWFADSKDFKRKQETLMELIKENTSWIPLENAILAIDPDRKGIVVLAPNPSLPGIIVLADGTTEKNTQKLENDYKSIVSKLSKRQKIDLE